ncbi:hypothetical protein ACMHYB_29450 [Sorangium sp. So ce1128]
MSTPAAAHVVYQVCNQGGADVDAGIPLTLFALASNIEVVVETRMLPALPAGTCLAGDSFVFDLKRADGPPRQGTPSCGLIRETAFVQQPLVSL